MNGQQSIVTGEEEIDRTAHYRTVRQIHVGADAVIVKRCFDNSPEDAWAALVNEHKILGRLQKRAGFPRILALRPDTRELVLEDFGRPSLVQSGLMGGCDLSRFLTVAIALAERVAAVHECRVIHRNIGPHAVRVNPDDLSLILTHFGTATTFAEEHSLSQEPSGEAQATSTMSPEQTGRTNRPLDYRTDLYSLGGTLYALATGHPPVEASDTLALVHAILAERPRPPRALAPWLPEEISALILTLLAKDPDERYQSAHGVAFDLRTMADALSQHRPLDTVPRRTRDLPLSPQLPSRLFGRESEVSALTEGFAAVTRGGSRSICVSGYSGVGKSVLVRELIRPAILAGGLFLSGKCEQFKSETPFLAPLQCLRRLVQRLLAEPDDVRADTCRRIVDSLGNDARVLIEVIPELELLIAPQPPAQELSPQQAQIRLQALLVAFLREVGSTDRPLVLFLDDLQWADQPTLNFVAAVRDTPGLEGLLLVVAYRDNEVDAAHPLTRVLRDIPSSDRMHLEPLAPQAVNDLLADMLHCSADDVGALAALLQAKTGGSPFFTIELAKTLFRDGDLVPDPAQGLWRWNEGAIAGIAPSGNVVDFLMVSMERKPEVVPDILVAAACLGSSGDLGSLGEAVGLPPAAVVEHLRLPLEYGIIVTGDVLRFERAEPSTPYWFCHDRMLQAVYQSRDANWRQRCHLSIAHNLAGRDDFQAAVHTLEAVPLIESAEERATARILMLAAARKARQAGAFPSAERFLDGALSLLPEDAREQPGSDAAALETERHLVLYCQAKYDAADAVYERLTEYVAPLGRVEARCSQIRSLSNRVRYADAVAAGAAFLRELDYQIPLSDPATALHDEMERFSRFAAAGALDSLGERIAPDDPRKIAIAKVLSGMISPAFFSRPELASWLSVHLTNCWLEEGYRRDYIYPMGCAAMSAIGLRSDYSLAYRASRAALKAGERLEGSLETARTRHTFALFCGHWFEPADAVYEQAKQSFGQTMRYGDIEGATFTFYTSLVARMNACGQVSQLDEEVEAALATARKTGNRHAEQAFVVFRQLARALKGDTVAPGAFDDRDFSEARHLDDIAGNPMAQCYFHIYRALSALLHDDRPAMLANVKAMLPLLPYIVGFYPNGLANQLHSFALLERLDDVAEPQRGALLKTIDENQAWLKARAADSPSNFAPAYHWIEAERLDRAGKHWEALQAFRDAMKSASGDRQPLQLALTIERAGRFHLRHGLDLEGRHLIQTAHDRYQQWGAPGKSWAMRARYPFLVSSGEPSAVSGLEQDALRSATQALASELSQSGLVDRLVPLMGQLAGATDVCLLVAEDGGGWFLEGGAHRNVKLERQSLTEAVARHLLPTHLGGIVSDLREPLMSEDTANDSRFMSDPCYGALPHCSLLALPIRLHGVLRAVLVLENRLFRAAFTARTVETVSVICSQLAASIENIRLYDALERKVADRTQELARRNDEQSRFISMLAHELRMPLSVIRMALRNTGPLGPANQRRCIQAIGDINDVVECCLYADRLEHGRINIAYESVDLAALVTSVAASFPERDRIDIQTEELPEARTDRRVASVIIGNLTGNALKYGRPDVPAAIQLYREGATAVVAVSNAIGSAGAPDPEQVFEKYYRSPQACNKTGSGLGLFIASNFARMIGGELCYIPDETAVRFELRIPT